MQLSRLCSGTVQLNRLCSGTVQLSRLCSGTVQLSRLCSGTVQLDRLCSTNVVLLLLQEFYISEDFNKLSHVKTYPGEEQQLRAKIRLSDCISYE